MMGNPPQSHNGRAPVRVTPVEDPHHPGVMTRVAAWLVDVALPRLVPDHLIASLRQRARDVDDRLERTAHRLLRRDANRGSRDRDADRGSTDNDGHSR
jgi:hypothetical protein